MVRSKVTLVRPASILFVALFSGILLGLPLTAAANRTIASPLPGDGTLALTIGDDDVDPGPTFSLDIALTDPAPVERLELSLGGDASIFRFISLDLGAGIEAYRNATGVSPRVTGSFGGSELGLTITFDVPYKAAEHGAEILSVKTRIDRVQGVYTLPWQAATDQNHTRGEATVTVGSPGPAFVRGDVNGDGTIDISDAVNLLSAITDGGFTLDCEDASDIDDGGAIDIGDAVRLLGGLFVDPGVLTPGCHFDTTPDSFQPCDRDSCP